MVGDCPLWLVTNLFLARQAQSERESAPQKENSPPKNDGHHPKREVINFKNLHENVLSSFYSTWMFDQYLGQIFFELFSYFCNLHKWENVKKFILRSSETQKTKNHKVFFFTHPLLSISRPIISVGNIKPIIDVAYIKPNDK